MVAVREQYLAARYRPAAKVGRGGYPVGHYRIGAAAERLHALDPHSARSRAVYPCPAGREKSRKVAYLGLARCVVYLGNALREHRGEHYVLGGSHRRHGERHLRAVQSGSRADYVAVLLVYLRAHSAERLEVEIYRPRAYLAAPGE